MCGAKPSRESTPPSEADTSRQVMSRSRRNVRSKEDPKKRCEMKNLRLCERTKNVYPVHNIYESRISFSCGCLLTVWTQDKDVLQCPQCSRQFGLTVRRYFSYPFLSLEVFQFLCLVCFRMHPARP